MKLVLRNFLLVILFSGFGYVNAQNWEHGIMIGASNYHGDLAYNIVPGETKPAFGLHTRYNFTPYWSFRNALSYGTISGSDKNFSDYQSRNLSFKNNILEFSSVFEFNFLPFGSRILSKDFSSYAMLGIAIFHHNPKAYYQGQWYDLRKLYTEGQSNKDQYGVLQMAIPFGGGIKYNITKNLVVGFEVGWRKTFTDYLDDVSKNYPDLKELANTRGTLAASLSDRSREVDGVGEPLSLPGDRRGDPALKDFYFFTMFQFSYRLTPIACWPKYHREFRFK
ncbi:MAG: hypothetical protein GC181_15580 [Bacteroidetes bacterium]|nr:hypothetical protein [Bacteroidota bacterium]